MTFLIVLIALVIERFFHWSHLRHWSWFSRYQYFLNTRFAKWPKQALLAASVLPLVLAIALLNCLLAGWLYGIPQILFGVVVLLYCLGPQNLWLQAYGCLGAMNKGDAQGVAEQVSKAFGVTANNQPQTFHQAFVSAIFVAANQRVFAVVFWFALLGPWAAVLYRLVDLSIANDVFGVKEIATTIRKWLDWIPARVFTFIFALSGNFMKVFTCWKKTAKLGVDANEALIGECGLAALSVNENGHIPENGLAEKEALELLDRVFAMVLVILALLVLAV